VDVPEELVEKPEDKESLFTLLPQVLVLLNNPLTTCD
jgi:hypothetical protein